MKNQVLQILVPNEVNGYKIIQLAGWNGKCLFVPRTELKEIEKRPEIKDPGIYFLFGDNDESINRQLYIGESERFFDRLISHDASKDFWNTAIIFTGGLDKAKVKYLEFLSTNGASKVNRYSLINAIAPKENSLSEFDIVSTQDYFSKIDFILTIFGYPVFQDVAQSISDKRLYSIKADGVDAKAYLLNDGSLNVLKGSLARIRETDSFWGWSLAARKKFTQDGIFKDSGDGVSYIFTRDVLFKSPSAAASTIKGTATNGWTAWRDESNKTMDENLRK